MIPNKEVYKLYNQKPGFTKLLLVLVFAAFSLGIFNNLLLGVVLGGSISLTLIFLEKMKYPGYLNFYLKFITTPKYLSANKYNEGETND